MKKKSQMMGQMFIYILAIIIFSFVLLYGYKAIENFGNQADEATLIQLITDFKTSVKKIKGDFGSVIKKEVSIPGVYDYICFVDVAKSGVASSSSICDPGNTDYHPSVCNSWNDEAQYNMFLITSKEDTRPYHIDGIKIENPYMCIDVIQGKIIVRLEGKGDYVDLSEWS